MAGEFEQARRELEDARLILVERFRVRRLLAFQAWPLAFLEAMAGRVDEAERAYRSALTEFRAANEGDHRGEVAARLALLLCSIGRNREAGTLAGEARAAIPATCVPVRALSMAATARSRQDPSAGSLTMAEEAVALTPGSMPNQKADVLAELALVQAAAGRRDRHLSSLETATDLYARKGNVAAVRLLDRP